MKKLVHMKQDPEETAEAATPAKPEGPRYPYGLSLQLDDASLKKLGLDSLPAADATCTVTGKAIVTHVSSSNDSGMGKSRQVTLQLTHLAVDMDESEKPDSGKQAGKLYAGSQA